MQFMDAGKVVEALMEVSQRIDALESENMALRAALKPFAKACDIYWPTTPDEYRFSDDELLVVSDLRAAAAALKETGDE